jgi:hypothetical protein
LGRQEARADYRERMTKTDASLRLPNAALGFSTLLCPPNKLILSEVEVLREFSLMSNWHGISQPISLGINFGPKLEQEKILKVLGIASDDVRQYSLD